MSGDENRVSSALRVRAVASLQAEVEKDLKVADPDKEKAKAALKDNKKD